MTMKQRIRYQIVLEGEYEINPVDMQYDTDNIDEIMKQEREWVEGNVGEFIMTNEQTTSKIVLIPL